MLIKKQKISPIPNYPCHIILPFCDLNEAHKAIIGVNSIKHIIYMIYQADFNVHYRNLSNDFCIIGIQSDYKYDDRFHLGNYIGSIQITKNSEPLYYFIFQYEEIQELKDYFPRKIFILNHECKVEAVNECDN